MLAARAIQRARGFLNASLPPARLRECAALDAAGERLVRDAVDRGGFSARGVDRALRVARTIADLAGEERLSAGQVAEALQYRAYESRRAASVWAVNVPGIAGRPHPRRSRITHGAWSKRIVARGRDQGIAFNSFCPAGQHPEVFP